jgi:hypothetical protein
MHQILEEFKVFQKPQRGRRTGFGLDSGMGRGSCKCGIF